MNSHAYIDPSKQFQYNITMTFNVLGIFFIEDIETKFKTTPNLTQKYVAFARVQEWTQDVTEREWLRMRCEQKTNLNEIKILGLCKGKQNKNVIFKFYSAIIRIEGSLTV